MAPELTITLATSTCRAALQAVYMSKMDKTSFKASQGKRPVSIVWSHEPYREDSGASWGA